MIPYLFELIQDNVSYVHPLSEWQLALQNRTFMIPGTQIYIKREMAAQIRDRVRFASPADIGQFVGEVAKHVKPADVVKLISAYVPKSQQQGPPGPYYQPSQYYPPPYYQQAPNYPPSQQQAQYYQSQNNPSYPPSQQQAQYYQQGQNYPPKEKVFATNLLENVDAVVDYLGEKKKEFIKKQRGESKVNELKSPETMTNYDYFHQFVIDLQIVLSKNIAPPDEQSLFPPLNLVETVTKPFFNYKNWIQFYKNYKSLPSRLREMNPDDYKDLFIDSISAEGSLNELSNLLKNVDIDNVQTLIEVIPSLISNPVIQEIPKLLQNLA